jgi:hypothetical protein
MPALPSRRPSRDLDWPVASRISYVLWRRKSWTGGLTPRVRAFWHHVVRGYGYEVCGDCGRPVNQAWVADDQAWIDVMGHEGGLLCIPCFDKKLEGSGRLVRWTPTTDEDAARPETAPRKRSGYPLIRLHSEHLGSPPVPDTLL